MRVADVVTAAVLFLLGGVVVFDAVRLGVGWGSDGPQSGFFPFWLAVIAMASCLAIIVQAARRSDGAPFLTREQARPVLKVLVPAVGLVLATHAVGLYVAAALYMGVYMRWIGGHRWVTVVALGVGIPLVTFVIFERWFLVPLPKGPLEAWLGY
ncbi:MAG: tripartite tricarboxylate transporter TctB family protein [Candidatus Rokubacteria bacterium]|nr:tripartite tricarboxylate transporter TctB family protein [Candidatus Rokubacteria bacterium]